MKWEQSTTTSGGKTTIHLTDEAKKRLRVGDYRPPDYDRMPRFDFILFNALGILFTALVVVTAGYLVCSHVFGGA